MEQVGDVFPLEVPGVCDIKVPVKRLALLRAEEADQLLRCEQVIFSLHAVAVGVLGTVKAALRGGHLPEDKVRRPFRR